MLATSNHLFSDDESTSRLMQLLMTPKKHSLNYGGNRCPEEPLDGNVTGGYFLEEPLTDYLPCSLPCSPARGGFPCYSGGRGQGRFFSDLRDTPSLDFVIQESQPERTQGEHEFFCRSLESSSLFSVAFNNGFQPSESSPILVPPKCCSEAAIFPLTNELTFSLLEDLLIEPEKEKLAEFEKILDSEMDNEVILGSSPTAAIPSSQKNENGVDLLLKIFVKEHFVLTESIQKILNDIFPSLVPAEPRLQSNSTRLDSSECVSEPEHFQSQLLLDSQTLLALQAVAADLSQYSNDHRVAHGQLEEGSMSDLKDSKVLIASPRKAPIDSMSPSREAPIDSTPREDENPRYLPHEDPNYIGFYSGTGNKISLQLSDLVLASANSKLFQEESSSNLGWRLKGPAGKANLNGIAGKARRKF